MDIKTIVREQRDRMIQTRRDLHRIPETAYTEKKTSEYVTAYLNQEGLSVETGIATYGVVATMETGKPGKTILFRADMDALPLAEKTGLPFSSTHDGVMHACGHDAHMAMVLGAATILNKLKTELTGTIKFLFQPAEEGPGGAKPMIEAGVLENPSVDHCFGCHLMPGVPEGFIGVKAGPFMAAMDRFDLKIFGKGGHGAMPHICVDALEIGAQVVNALQRITSRHMNPLTPTVVTIGSFHAGTAFNIIPDKAELSGTTRTFDRAIWDSWPERLEKIIHGVCHSMDASYELDFQKGYPPTINDTEMADFVRNCAAEVVGQSHVIEPEPIMGGEDMSYFLEETKGCFFFLGVGRKNAAPIHNPEFDFNEDVLPLGVETFCRIAFGMLK